MTDRSRYKTLCGLHVAQNLVGVHSLIRCTGFGDFCEWCDEPQRLADFLVDLSVTEIADESRKRAT